MAENTGLPPLEPIEFVAINATLRLASSAPEGRLPTPSANYGVERRIMEALIWVELGRNTPGLVEIYTPH